MKLILFLMTLLISFSTFSRSKIPSDNFTIGLKNSSSDKRYIFNTGDFPNNRSLSMEAVSKLLKFDGNDFRLGDGSPGSKTYIFNNADAVNPSLSVDYSGSDLIYNKPFIQVGDGTNQNSGIKIDIGQAANNPAIEWDSATNSFKQRVDNSLKGLGGGASGGGNNFNNAFGEDDNANAENGTTNWTASAGVFAVDSTDPLEGDSSFTWSPSAQGDTLDSIALDFDRDIFKGRSCQAQIEYIGGDENLTLQVIDADGDVLGSEVLKTHTITSTESVFFLCPKSIVANDLDLRLRILNEGVAASALIKFDKSYVGTLIGLTETALPDAFGGYSNAANTVVNVYGGDITISKTGIGNFNLNFSSLGLTKIPSCSASCGGSDRNGETVGVSTTNASILCERKPDGVDLDSDVHFTCHKTGADAKQSVQVYKSIPKVSENINIFSGSVGNSFSLSAQTTDWITNCTNQGGGVARCNFVSGLFSELPICTATSIAFNNNIVDVLQATDSFVEVRVQNSSGGAVTAAFNFTCQRKDNDYKTATVQPVIVGQVRNTSSELGSKNINIESCSFAANGTVLSNSGLCESWIDSVSQSATGQSDITFSPGTFSKRANCLCGADTNNVGDRECHVRSYTGTDNIRVQVTSNATDQSYPFTVFCMGER